MVGRRIVGRCVAVLVAMLVSAPLAAPKPRPLLSRNHPVDWWFVFKFNAESFPGCPDSIPRTCVFGGEPQPYAAYSQRYVVASSKEPRLRTGGTCLGADSVADPLGATFEQVYSGSYNYVVWNDQFYDDPEIDGCSKSCPSPWGHSKGMVAWNDDGEGFVLQVSTPSWPGSGSRRHPRAMDGNTLGCVEDNDVKVSQHFFALRLDRKDLPRVLRALRNASVVTNPRDPRIVRNGGPTEIVGIVDSLGAKSDAGTATMDTLSSGVVLISKPSALHVPPWQLVSSLLGKVPLRTATWWTRPAIPTTTMRTEVACWDPALRKPGAVEIATSGQWNGTAFGLRGGPGKDYNHAKIGVSRDDRRHYVIFGDLNQQGTLSGPNCGSSQNGRGGLFYVVGDSVLHAEVKGLIRGSTASTQPGLR